MKNVAVALTAVFSLAGLGHASASAVEFIYTGTVSSGYDTAGYFGAADTDLSGKSFKVIETFDSAKAGGGYAWWGYNYQYGGSAYGAPDFASAKIQIGTSGFRSIANQYSQNYSGSGYNANYVEASQSSSRDDGFSGAYEYTSFSTYAPSLTADDHPTTITFDGINAFGSGLYNSAVYSYDFGSWSYQYNQPAYANLNLQTLTVGAVPLPSSARLFGAGLLGLGVVGFRAKRRKVAVTA